MAAITLPRIPMQKLIDQLRKDYPYFTFVKGDRAFWSPNDKTIVYTTRKAHSLSTTLHELGHGLLEHIGYQSDMDLLHKERAAWKKARTLAGNYSVDLDESYIENCLDTYRNWLHDRSTCPRCKHHGLQPSDRRYSCLNCKLAWKVSDARFCRTYRLSIDKK